MTDRLIRTRRIVFFRTRPTVFSEQDRSSFLIRTRLIVFFEQDPPSFPSKSDRLFRFSERLYRTRPTVLSEYRTCFTQQDQTSFSEQHRSSFPQTIIFPNKTDCLFRTRPNVFTQQDRTSLPNKTGRLFRTASSPSDFSCSRYKTHMHNDNCYCY